MILVPSLEPSNYTIEDKIQYILNNLDQYKIATGSVVPIGYINFILPGYLEDKPDLNIALISPNLIESGMITGFMNTDLTLYINYFASPLEMQDKLSMYDSDLIMKSGLISAAWKITVFVPLHTIDTRLDKSKFNINYGLTLVGEDINLINIQKYSDAGITHFNLQYLDLPTSFTYTEAKAPLLKELGTKFKESEFVICAKDARLLKLPDNCKVVVSSSFWNELLQ